ncbi:hypothetical protein [Streptomyces sp. PTD5-9]|uniref:hypothetical protein n=1 Tax=Streptomyces sp. PTD5-9 TaxID=3120150 RepID=UPI00300905A8
MEQSTSEQSPEHSSPERSSPARFAPLPDRIGYVGGVEALTLDGRRYYFGFDYKSDVVLSPLIDDPAAMAAFASEHMRQTTGRHDAAYWADLVAAAEDEVVGLDGPDRADADRDTAPAAPHGGLSDTENHVLYLLGAATEWEDWFDEAPEVRQAYERLGFDEEDPEFVDHCLQAVREHGEQARPDEWAVARFHLTMAARHLPGNWRALFTPVVEDLLNRR